MKNQSKLKNILFIDIETVREFEEFHKMPSRLQKHWAKKALYINRSTEPILDELENAQEMYPLRAGIYAEYAKIVCITVGYLIMDDDDIEELRLRSFYGHSEKEILEDFCKMLDKYFDNPKKHALCGHNIKEFDVPFICRRILIHRMDLPVMLQVSGKKPWETKHLLDTMELWKFGDYKHFISLDLLSTLFDIDSPKDDIDGSQVGNIYWDDNDPERIALYCEKDVVSVCRVYLKLITTDDLEIKTINSTTEWSDID